MVKKSCTVPDFKKISSLQELRSLRIAKVEAGENTLKFTLNDGQSCKMGLNEIKHSDELEPAIKITRIEMFVHKDEREIILIKFYHH